MLKFASIVTSIVLLVLLLSCDSKPGNHADDGIGGCLNFALSEKYQTLDPIKVKDLSSFHIANQIFEPLLRFSEKDLSIRPLLAKAWKIGEKNLTYTFTLKKGIYFHDNSCFEGGKGREIKANDVVYSFQRIFSTKGDNYAYNLFQNSIADAEKYRNEGGNFTGVKAIDDYTVEFTLSKPSSNFLSLLATVFSAIVPKEAMENGVVVGTGPFYYSKEGDIEKGITLLKNPNYHVLDASGIALPYLDSVYYKYVGSERKQLELFMRNELDIIGGVPSESVKEILEDQISDFQSEPVKHVLIRHPQGSITYLNINTALIPGNDQKVRQAIAMAIDKSRIVDNILKGEAHGPGNHGVVPPAINNYDFSSIIGLEYDVEKAKSLLAKAGYPNGKGFPTLLLSVTKGGTDLRVGLDIQKQLLNNLNINVEISSLSLQEQLEGNYFSGFNLSINSWLGEFPDPVTFLSLFYGKGVPESKEDPSFPNQSRFKSLEFDQLFERALMTTDRKKRYELCLSADQLIATETPVIPLWYHERYQLIQATVKNYKPNAMNIQYLVNVQLNPPPVIEENT